jgi:hypothetical protein
MDVLTSPLVPVKQEWITYRSHTNKGLFWEDRALSVSVYLTGCKNLLLIESTDSMLYARGSAEDYDRMARLTGDPGWSWNSIFPYFIKVSAAIFLIRIMVFI